MSDNRSRERETALRELCARLSNDEGFLRGFRENPTAVLRVAGVIGKTERVVVKGEEKTTQPLQIVVFPDSPAADPIETLDLKVDVPTFFEQLPAAAGDRPRPCAIPGGCSGSF